jgi:hypothetical protein
MSRQSAIIGTACCIASALGYTTVNCLKRFLTTQCDRPMMLAVQDSVSVVLVGVWLIWRYRKAKRKRGDDTNPKRERGQESETSLTLRLRWTFRPRRS